MVFELPFWIAYVSILVTCVIGFAFGLYNCYTVLNIDTKQLPVQQEDKAEGEEREKITNANIEEMNLTAEKIQSVNILLILRELLPF